MLRIFSKTRVLPALLIVVLSFTACDDSKEAEETHEITFTLKFTPEFTRVKEYEVIVLSATNKHLKRVVAKSGVETTINVSSPTDKINLAVIDSLHNPVGNVSVRIQAFLNVTPGNWDLTKSTALPETPQTTSTSVAYQNLPSLTDNRMYFASRNSWGWVAGDDEAYALYYPDLNYVAFNCFKSDDDYAYFVIPSLGKYKFKKLEGLQETLDCSDLTDGTKVKLTGAPEMPHSIRIMGYPEKNNYSIKLNLYPDIGLFQYEDFDFIAPKNLFEHYELYYYGTKDRGIHEYFKFGDELPEAVTLFSESNHSMKHENNSLSFSFTDKNPTAVMMWLFSYSPYPTDLYITCPSDLGVINYIDFTKALASSMATRVDEYEMALNSYTLVKVNGLSYPEYQNYTHSSSVNKPILSEQVFFSKDLR